MSAIVSFRNLGLRSTVSAQRRFAGGWLRKNIYVEENQGLREATYKTWKFTTSNMLSILFGLILPSALYYNLIVMEMKKKDKQIGIEREYFLIPPLSKFK